MLDIDILLEGLKLVAHWHIPLIMFIGMLLGLIFGVIPGLIGGLCIAVLLPVTYLMQPITALAFLTAVYTGGLTGGGITAVIINTPGAPAAVATTFDGYPMTKKGMQNEALGYQVAASVIGGLIGYLFLIFLLDPMVKLALNFGPSEMLFLTLLVFIVIGTFGNVSLPKAMMAGFIGLLVGTVGTSGATDAVRGTMGIELLEYGIPAMIPIVGMFAIPEIMELVTRSYITTEKPKKGNDLKKILKSMLNAFKYPLCIIRSSLVGFALGVLPGIGGTIACLISYDQAKKKAKPEQKFGQGEPEGIVAAEVSNNASEGGAIGILLALGIPGSGTAAMLIAAFMLHGLSPGPRLISEQGPLIYGLLIANLFQMVLLIVAALIVAYYIGKIIYLPNRHLVPILLAIMAIGVFSVRHFYLDIGLLFFFGFFAWFLRKFEFPILSLMIGIILGERLDMEIYRYSAIFGSDISVLFKRPITGVIFATILLLVGINIYNFFKERKKA